MSAFKKWYIWVIALLVLANGVVYGMVIKKGTPVDIADQISVEFGGYDKYGTAKIADYKGVVSTVFKDKKISKEDQKKFKKDLKVTLDKSTGLSNGQEVKLSVKTTLEDNPIKSGEKTFKVSGLDELPNISNIDDVLSRIDGRIKSDFAGNSAYKWTISREKEYFIIGGSVSNTNSYTNKESEDADVPGGNISLLTVYHFKGTGSMTDDEDIYLVAGISNVPIESSGEIPVSNIGKEKYYVQLENGGGKITLGFLNWGDAFESIDDANAWVISEYPAASLVEQK